MDQRTTDERIKQAVQKYRRGAQLSDYEWRLVQYANQPCMPVPPEHRLWRADH